MITNSEEFIKIQWLLALSNISTTDCFKVNALIIKLSKENQRLKKQLEEQIATNEVLSHELTKDKILKQDHLTTCCGMSIKNVQNLINQQKEFIKYLEDESKEVYRDGGLRQNIFRQILQKYKEIIGDDK